MDNNFNELEKDYYFKLVCLDEQNPVGLFILENEIIDNLNDVHKFVKKHFGDHAPEITKWELIPVRKNSWNIP